MADKFDRYPPPSSSLFSPVNLPHSSYPNRHPYQSYAEALLQGRPSQPRLPPKSIFQPPLSWFRSARATSNCHRCGDAGHRAISCRDPIKCFYCGKLGHKKITCASRLKTRSIGNRKPSNAGPPPFRLDPSSDPDFACRIRFLEAKAHARILLPPAEASSMINRIELLFKAFEALTAPANPGSTVQPCNLSGATSVISSKCYDAGSSEVISPLEDWNEGTSQPDFKKALKILAKSAKAPLISKSNRYDPLNSLGDHVDFGVDQSIRDPVQNREVQVIRERDVMEGWVAGECISILGGLATKGGKVPISNNIRHEPRKKLKVVRRSGCGLDVPQLDGEVCSSGLHVYPTPGPCLDSSSTNGNTVSIPRSAASGSRSTIKGKLDEVMGEWAIWSGTVLTPRYDVFDAHGLFDMEPERGTAAVIPAVSSSIEIPSSTKQGLLDGCLVCSGYGISNVVDATCYASKIGKKRISSSPDGDIHRSARFMASQHLLMGKKPESGAIISISDSGSGSCHACLQIRGPYLSCHQVKTICC